MRQHSDVDAQRQQVEESKARIPLLRAQTRKASAEAQTEETENKVISDFLATNERVQAMPAEMAQSVVAVAKEGAPEDKQKAVKLMQKVVSSSGEAPELGSKVFGAQQAQAAGQEQQPGALARVQADLAAKRGAPAPSTPNPFAQLPGPSGAATPGPQPRPEQPPPAAGGFTDQYRASQPQITEMAMQELNANRINPYSQQSAFEQSAANNFGIRDPARIDALRNMMLVQGAKRGDIGAMARQFGVAPGEALESRINPFLKLGQTRQADTAGSENLSQIMEREALLPYRQRELATQAQANVALAGKRGESGGGGVKAQKPLTDAQKSKIETDLRVIENNINNRQKELNELDTKRSVSLRLPEKPNQMTDKDWANIQAKGSPKAKYRAFLETSIENLKAIKERQQARLGLPSSGGSAAPAKKTGNATLDLMLGGSSSKTPSASAEPLDDIDAIVKRLRR